MNEKEKIASIINKRVGTDEGCVVGYKDHRKITTTIDTKVIAEYLTKAGYINGADFVSNVAWKLANKIEWENHGRTLDLEEINQILDEALQEYLKGE